jgi:hypothetical protein
MMNISHESDSDNSDIQNHEDGNMEKRMNIPDEYDALSLSSESDSRYNHSISTDIDSDDMSDRIPKSMRESKRNEMLLNNNDKHPKHLPNIISKNIHRGKVKKNIKDNAINQSDESNDKDDESNDKDDESNDKDDESNDKDDESDDKDDESDDKDDDIDQSDEPIKDETLGLMKKNYSYPDPDDPNIQYKLYKKREYYSNKIPSRPDITNEPDYTVIKDYRDNTCARPFTLHEHQGMLSNIINPDTPYKGILVYHGLGSGKCVGKDTNVYINDKYIKIHAIWEDYADKLTIISDATGGEWAIPLHTLTVFSFDDNRRRLIPKPVKYLYREKVDTTVKHIILESGKEIVITDNHKLLTTDGWTTNFNINDFICVPIIDKKTGTYTTGIEYSQIKTIKRIRYNDYVYDLEIADTHNYVANDILCHNTCVGIAIAEKFKPIIQKYNTKIYILVPGPILKEQWRKHLLLCTGETYKKYQDKYVYTDAAEKNRREKQAIAMALQNYRIMSYKSFYKRTLGEKVMDKKVTKGSKTKTTYRKNKEGEFERDMAVDRIYNLNNSVIIVDEAHNLTGNAYGMALKKIIETSINLKTVLMSGTSMKNLGSDIVEMINFIRPADFPMERDKIFNSFKNHMMDFKPGGLEYFKNMINGYVSHVRGSDPLTFAKRVDKGVVPNGLLFTNVIRCQMMPFQRNIYDITVRDFDDALDRSSEAVANMAFPGLTKDRKNLIGYYGREGMIILKEQLKVSSTLLNKKIGDMFGEKTNDDEWLHISQDGRSVTGKIYKAKYLKHFSIKFYKTLKKVNRLVTGKKGSRTAFIYSNLVKVGIDVLQAILLQNGYLEFKEDASNYQIGPDTICYYCGKTYANHTKLNRIIRRQQNNNLKRNDSDYNYYGKQETIEADDFISTDGFSTDSDSDGEEQIKNVATVSETSTEYTPRQVKNLGKVPMHKFYPAAFMSITGKSNEEKAEMINDDKKRILDNIFNTMENKEGKFIKLILGSKVMNEGISMKNVSEVHVVDVYFNLGKVDQVVGRAIRWCSHYKVMGENNVWPYVNVYKYVVALGKDSADGLSSEEELYKKAEMKYLLINKLERAMKERSFDCPLNMNGNIFAEEVIKYKNCDKHGLGKCPAICNYTRCDYKCDDPKLNAEYYDPNRNIYKLVPNGELDYSTFTHNLAETEIEFAKKKIKNMYITNPVYTLKDIVDYIKNSYDDEKRDMFDEFFAFKALDSLIPVTENDFNNFRDTIVDKNNTQGYLIYRDNYYIFQPFNQNEDVPLYYRNTNTQDINYKLSLYNYLKNSNIYRKIKGDNKKGTTKNGQKKLVENINMYDFDATVEYYDNRDEYDIVGIIDKETTRKKDDRVDENRDIFKIRDRLPKVLDKKRGTGIPSSKGAVCSTSKAREYLEEKANMLGVKVKPEMARIEICNAIEHIMLEKEKYATTKDKNKMTYIRIPANHPKYKFPYNLEDRVKHITNKILSEIKQVIDITESKEIVKTGPNKGNPKYLIQIKYKPILDEYKEFFKSLGANISKKNITIEIE